MMSSAVALSSLNPAGLRLLCTITSCAGLIVVLFGLRLNRRASTSSREPDSLPAAAPPIPKQPLEQSPAATQEIIRLTTNSGPTRSSEMTQQQKIAAALDRAGIASSTTWATPAESCTEHVTSTSTSSAPTPALSPSTDPVQTPSSSLARKLSLLLGSLLALISLIVFLTFR